MMLRERVYRKLLAGYPRPFRDQHAACMLATLLDGAEGRGAIGELRELGGLVGGGLRARAELARRAGQGEWRHGLAMLLAPLAAVNLAVIGAAFWVVQNPRGLGVVHGVSKWWVAVTLAAVALVGAVAAQRRWLAIAAAVVGLIPLGSDEWLQASGRGDLDHFSIAGQRGFDGPLMSPFWLFLAASILVAVVAGGFGAPTGRALRRLAALIAGAVVVAATIPTSLHLLLALALLGAAACAVLGAWDRRLHGVGLMLWVVTLPYVFWWFASSYPAHPVWLLPYLGVLPLTATSAWLGRRRQRLLT
jgi:hypothetical protein